MARRKPIIVARIVTIPLREISGRPVGAAIAVDKTGNSDAKLASVGGEPDGHWARIYTRTRR